MFLLKELFVFMLTASLQYSLTSATNKVSCRNEQNEEVEWFYMYKLPKHYSNDILSDDTSGLRYLFMTSKTYNTVGWQLSRQRINESTSIPGQTLGPLFVNDSILLLAYNDENPNGSTDFTNGHTKGVVATDMVNSIWLIHSVPKYPPIPVYDYPTSGEHYGQSFLCISLNASQVNTVGQQLLFNEPNIYFNRVPNALAGKYPNLELAIAKKWKNTAPFNGLAEVTSSDGTVFRSFAKGRKFFHDLYEDWVAAELDVSLYVETWRNGAGNLPSNCTKINKVFNVATITEPGTKFSFKATADHSKWAVTTNATSDWVCVGDINRQQHQLLRGGGTVCQRNAELAMIYRNMVSSYDKCGERV